MVAKNDITGDKIQTRPTTKEYSDNWDKIFGNCKRTPEGDLEVQVLRKCPNKEGGCFCTGICMTKEEKK